jgi:hypothetical protein
MIKDVIIHEIGQKKEAPRLIELLVNQRRISNRPSRHEYPPDALRAPKLRLTQASFDKSGSRGALENEKLQARTSIVTEGRKRPISRVRGRHRLSGMMREAAKTPSSPR